VTLLVSGEDDTFIPWIRAVDYILYVLKQEGYMCSEVLPSEGVLKGTGLCDPNL
jgi:hypothetical protein